MNQKYLIALLVFFFLIHVEKTYGCYPIGTGCGPTCGAKVIDANLSNEQITLTVVGGPRETDYFNVDGLGHFTLQIDNGPYRRLLGEPYFYNGFNCDHVNDDTRKNPFTYTWNLFNFETPPSGTWFDVWISIYWSCSRESGISRQCHSEDVHLRTYVK